MAANNKMQQTKKALIEAMRSSLGVVTTACKKVGVDRTTYYRYYRDDDDFRNAVDDVENIALDFVESQLHKQIKEGSTAATIFYLKCKGKKRGYVEKQEIEHSGKINNDVINIKVASEADIKEVQKLINGN